MATINTRIKIKKDTADHLANNNPTPLDGELVSNENFRLKEGNGSSAYNSKRYLFSKGPASGSNYADEFTVTNWKRYTVTYSPGYQQTITLEPDSDLPNIIKPATAIMFSQDRADSDSRWNSRMSEGCAYIPNGYHQTLTDILNNGTQITLNSTNFPNADWAVGTTLRITVKAEEQYCGAPTVTSYAQIGTVTVGSDQAIYVKITQTSASTSNKRLHVGNAGTPAKGTLVDSVPGGTDTYPDGGVYTDGYWYEKSGTTSIEGMRLPDPDMLLSYDYEYIHRAFRLTNSDPFGILIVKDQFSVGDEISFITAGTGQVIFIPETGVTLHSPDNIKAVQNRWSLYRLKKIGTNEWLLIGGNQ